MQCDITASNRELNHKLTRPSLDAQTVCGRRRDFNIKINGLRAQRPAAPEASAWRDWETA